MKTKKTTILVAILLTTGIALAQPADIPEPGLTPESPFYALEKASERLELAVAQAPIIGSEELEAKVRANHAAETLAEAGAMAEKNNTEQVEILMKRYSENMNRSIASASSANQTDLKEKLANVTNNQNRALEALDDRVPEQAKIGIQRAMDNNRKNQERLGKTKQTPNRPNPKAGAPEQETGKTQESPSDPITGRATTPEKAEGAEPKNKREYREEPSEQQDRVEKSGRDRGP